MKARILDTGALRAISPASLAAYARGEGWKKSDAYGRHADIYTARDRPEILLPRTDLLSDYASVVSRLMGIFSEVTKQGRACNLWRSRRCRLRCRQSSHDREGKQRLGPSR